jgi:dsDNA-specific endonuclease/ATPase MutS2
MKTYGLLLSLVMLSSLAAAQTTGMSRDEYQAAKSRIEAEGEADEARCKALQGNAKDVCEEEAEGREDVAKAELEQRYKPSARNARKVAEAKIEAAYEIAKERCDAQTGNAKDVCEREAKTQERKAKADLRSARK